MEHGTLTTEQEIRNMEERTWNSNTEVPNLFEICMFLLILASDLNQLGAFWDTLGYLLKKVIKLVYFVVHIKKWIDVKVP